MPPFIGNVEAGKAAIGEPDIRDDRSVRLIVEVKEGTGPNSEVTGLPFTQFAERADLSQETGESLEPGLAAQSWRGLKLGHVATYAPFDPRE